MESRDTPLIVRNEIVSPEIGNNRFVISRFFLVSFSRDKNKLRPIRRKYCASLYLWCRAKSLSLSWQYIYRAQLLALVNRLTTVRCSDNKQVESKYLPFSQLRVKLELYEYRENKHFWDSLFFHFLFSCAVKREANQ